MRLAETAGATSPLGVMMLIAVAVLLAFATFFFVNRLTDESDVDEPRAELAFSLDDSEPTATVVRASVGLDWARDLVLSGDCHPSLNGAPFPTAPGMEVASGDVLRCGPGTTLVISSSDDWGNVLLFEHRFAG